MPRWTASTQNSEISENGWSAALYRFYNFFNDFCLRTAVHNCILFLLRGFVFARHFFRMSLSSQPSFDPAMSGLLLRSLVPASYVIPTCHCSEPHERGIRNMVSKRSGPCHGGVQRQSLGAKGAGLLCLRSDLRSAPGMWQDVDQVLKPIQTSLANGQGLCRIRLAVETEVVQLCV